ncbi:class V lanthionine synthetase subunit LxmK [Kineococcus arenarius]|uniref:class V lanthionine synthetase subunit LxmK n=1 Tax=unclassified Kineococcus TaxID=2621656 RepID=UPI003D7CAC28
MGGDPQDEKNRRQEQERDQHPRTREPFQDFEGNGMSAVAPPPVLRPLDLAIVPEVDAFIASLGSGRLDPASASDPLGRNDIWSGRTDQGRAIFVKRIAGRIGGRERFDRSVSFERFADATGLFAPRRGRLIGEDPEHRLLAFDHVEARTGAHLMIEEAFDEDLAADAGALVGQLHSTAVPAGLELDRTQGIFPPVEFLHGLPAGAFQASSAGELAAWRLLQHDRELVQALTGLRRDERQVDPVPSHGDLRVDQFLVTEGESGPALHLTDWEEFRLSDPARDVGAFAGEWLFRGVLDIVTDRGEAAFVDVEFTHDVVLERGAAKLQRLLPLVRSFWASYRQVRPVVDPGLSTRATAFAGWHLIDRLIAGATRTSRLSGIERAAAGIGRNALLSPDRFADVLGLGDLS